MRKAKDSESFRAGFQLPLHSPLILAEEVGSPPRLQLAVGCVQQDFHLPRLEVVTGNCAALYIRH